MLSVSFLMSGILERISQVMMYILLKVFFQIYFSEFLFLASVRYKRYNKYN